MVAWGPLLRRLARILVPLALRHVRRRDGAGRRGGGSDDADRATGEVIDVEAVGAFDRYDEPARRAVVRAAEIAGGVGFTADALLLGLVETWPPLERALEEGGGGVAGLRETLDGRLAVEPPHGPTPGARRALVRAVARADDRGRFELGRRDLLGALLDPSVGLADRLGAPTLEVLRRL